MKKIIKHNTLITCTVTSAVHARFQCMKSALVKPQNARMSDSECGHVGLNACRFHVLKVSNATARVTVSVIMYDNESTYSSTSLQNNEHRVIV